MLISRALFLTFVAVLMFSSGQPSAQSQSMQEGASMQSLFKGDTCAPPCWFGLTPGISSAQDVIPQLDVFYSVVDYDASIPSPEENDVIQFSWPVSTYDDTAFFANRLIIEEDTVSAIEIWMNRRVYLGDVLHVMGMPSYVLAATDFDVSLNLIYPKQRVIVRVNEADNTQDCRLDMIQRQLRVSAVSYYDAATFQERLETYSFGYLFEGKGYFFVDVITFANWLKYPSDRTCGELIIEQEFYLGPDQLGL